MTLWVHEFRLLARHRFASGALVLLMALSAAALFAGLAEVSRQHAAIAAIPKAQAEDIDAIAGWVDKSKDAGSAAYYSFHPTWDAPSPLAFAALGMRDVSPYILRVRALGLEAQIYDGDTFNPELALPGRFDFAFVLVFLAPLFVIALCHDLVSGEREAGRQRMLEALPFGGKALWRRRTLLRLALLWTALCAPFAVAAIVSGVGFASVLAVLVATAGIFRAACRCGAGWHARSQCLSRIADGPAPHEKRQQHGHGDAAPCLLGSRQTDGHWPLL